MGSYTVHIHCTVNVYRTGCVTHLSSCVGQDGILDGSGHLLDVPDESLSIKWLTLITR